jgi:predicted transcriptional regulator
MSTPKEIRAAARESQMRTAVMAGVSQPTVRLYEANPSSVTLEKRIALDAVYAQLRAKVTANATT